MTQKFCISFPENVAARLEAHVQTGGNRSFLVVEAVKQFLDNKEKTELPNKPTKPTKTTRK